MKDTKFGVSSSTIFKRFEKNGLNTTFVLDLKQHEKNVNFFKKYKFIRNRFSTL